MVELALNKRRPNITGSMVILAFLGLFVALVLFTYPTLALYALAFATVVASVIVIVTFRLTVKLASGREIHFLF